MPIKAADVHCKMMHPHVQRDLAFSAKTSRQVNLGLSSRGPIGAMANRRVWPLALLVVAFFFASRTFVAAPGRASDVTAPRAASETAAAASAAAAGLAALPGPAWAEDGGDWFQPFVNLNAQIIEGIDGVVGSAGVAVVLYTILLKVVTYPLQQPALRTSALSQLLSPQVDELEKKFPLDEEARGKALRELYGTVGLNPFAAFLPILFQLPIFIALFRAIGSLANQDDHFKEPFLWIPSLAGPVASGRPSLDWLLKTQSSDHFEPLVGWQEAGGYLVLPLLIFALQYFSNRMSASKKDDVAAGVLAPAFIMISTLVSPQAVGIYWFTNTLLTTGQMKLTQNQVAEEYPEYKKIKDAVDEQDDGRRYTRASPFVKNDLVAKSVEDLGDKQEVRPKSRAARRKKGRKSKSAA
ncbi:unnamed protein product [Effrenium voratum]|nr:unnamed protein product [Effrenium voratum]